ncbi:MAG: hypothetical protein ACTSRK_21095 [Promethearchaeota archaeon]
MSNNIQHLHRVIHYEQTWILKGIFHLKLIEHKALQKQFGRIRQRILIDPILSTFIYDVTM